MRLSISARGGAVNDHLQTTNGDIYAVGDAASKYQFTHMADFMARLVIQNALFFGRDKVPDLLVPWATYSPLPDACRGHPAVWRPIPGSGSPWGSQGDFP